MDGEAFDFAFTLFGFLLGLSLAELFGGFARAFRARERVRMGWLCPLLALLMVIDLVSFWTNAWAQRDVLPLTFPTLLFGAAVAGIYYFAAALVFPERVDDWPDLDDYYFTQKRWIVAAVQSSNLLLIGGMIVLRGNFFTTPVAFLRLGLWLTAGLALILARSRRLNLAVLLIYLQLYWVERLFG